MNEQEFVFDFIDKYSPEIVIGNLLKQIESATRGYVCGHIQEYDGEITSYTKEVGGFSAALSAFQKGAETVHVDIQEDLGEQDYENHRYEVFLSAKGLEHYKYRMMFVDYGTVSYPVTIVMNEDLAVEYTGKRITNFNVESMKELENMVNQILSCKTMLSLIQNLINEAIRQENKTVSQATAKTIQSEKQ